MYPVDLDVKADQIDYEIEQNTKVESCLHQAADLLEEVLPGLTPTQKADGERMYALVRFMQHTTQTVLNVKQWHKLKWTLGYRPAPAENSKKPGFALCEEVFDTISKEERTQIIRKMQALAEAEMENARRTIPLVQLDSRLGFEPSMEYIGDEAHILWKLDTTKKALEEEILPLLER
jgi:hypothetical protein